MYLKALEVQGFKSFPDKTVLTFSEEITAIVGPNGAGKSNIADAIRWVTGEQSSKNLRGSKMEDVIFDGTAQRKGVGFAEVSLILDNTEHLFPLDDSELDVTRRYYRSGESEYYINRHSCRLKDINELFMDTGLGREGYSMIGQGKIDEILSIKSADRREIFEEAAGISRFRHRKEEAERRLERTEENLLRINDKIDELELQVEPLRIQAEKTKKFLVFREELKGLEVSVWLDQLEKARTNEIKISADYEITCRQLSQVQCERDRLYSDEEACAEDMRKKDLEIEALRDELNLSDSRGNEYENEISILKNDIKNNMENVGRIRAEMGQQENRAGSITSQIQERQERMSQIRSEMQQSQAALDELTGKLSDAVHSAGSLSSEMSELQEKERIENASANEARILLSALAAAAQELLDRENDLEQELVVQTEKKTSAELTLEAIQKEYEKTEEDCGSAKNVVSGYQIRCQTRERKLEEIQEQYRKLQMDENNLTSRIHMLSEMEKMYEGYSKAVKMVMGETKRNVLRGIRGPVAELIHVPDQYSVAIEIALGGALQNIVVERDEDAKNAISWLKHRDGGRATFLPMNTIRASHFPDADVQQEPGFVGMGDHLISFDEEYGDIFSNLLGRIVIVQNLDRALEISGKFRYRFRIVTLDGQVMNVGGSMTGGSVSRGAGILSRANELERLNTQKKEIQSDLKKTEAQLSSTKRELAETNYEMETAMAQLRQTEDSLLKLTERRESAEALLKEAKLRCSELSDEREQVRKKMEENNHSTELAKARIGELEGSTAAIRAEQEAKALSQDDLQQRMTEINQQIAEENTKLAGLEGERAASEQNLNELEQLQRELSDDAEKRFSMITDYEQKNGELTLRIREAEENLQVLRSESQMKADAIRRINDEKLELEGKRNQAGKNAREKNEEMLNLQGEVSVLENKKTAVAMEEKQLLDRLWDTYELSHEAAKAQRVDLQSPQKAQRRILELKHSISDLGSINPNAIEEFQKVNERYTYFCSQRNDVSRVQTEVQGIISEITEEMTVIFREQFEKINLEFQKTFLELFGGGKAELELEDPDDILNCGIEIRVQPPGKALKTITLLSGGEKAFVAIALYFSILKVKPTPFCVLDEIEAALDDPNVIRFAQYMRKMSDKTQFIVITHRRGTMEEADVLYGVTMQEQGISRMLSINLNDAEREFRLK